jgi:magnesium transporter
MNKGTVKRELIGNEGMVLLDTYRRLIRRNAVDHLLRMLNKTHPADVAWLFRHLNPGERKTVFSILAQTEAVAEFLSELDRSIMLELVQGLTPQFMVAIIEKMAGDDAADLWRPCQKRRPTRFAVSWTRRSARRLTNSSNIIRRRPAAL